MALGWARGAADLGRVEAHQPKPHGPLVYRVAVDDDNGLAGVHHPGRCCADWRLSRRSAHASERKR